MSQASARSDQPGTQDEPVRLEVEYLDPGEIRFSRMTHGGLQIVKGDGETFEHVIVYRTHPLSMPDEYISVRIGRSELEQKEIGIIRRLDDLRREDRALILEELRKRYFSHTVESIESIEEEMGYFYWVVDTDKGRREFPVPIRPRHITFVRPRGRIITDIDGNRYGIRDLEKLDAVSQAIFHKHIYW